MKSSVVFVEKGIRIQEFLGGGTLGTEKRANKINLRLASSKDSIPGRLVSPSN